MSIRQAGTLPRTGAEARSIDRRQALLALAALGAAALPRLAVAEQPTTVKTRARIVIVGAGAAGLATASRLAASLDGARIILIDPRREHFYQPGFTLIAAGLKPVDYVISRTAEYLPPGVELIPEHVTQFDPDSQRVHTGSQAIAYDYLVIATGLALEYGLIEGMDAGLIGSHGVGSVYHGPQAAQATWRMMSAFVGQGGRGIFTRPATEIKCAGAPLKMAFITEDYLRRRGTRDKAEITYNAHNDALFGVPIVSEKVRMLFESRAIRVNYRRTLRAIDPARRIATFDTPEGLQDQGYDFIHVVPPMRAPQAIRNSPLPWQSGPWQAEGWVEVDPRTLRHARYPNVFAVGDVAGVPKGKTAASVKWQVPVAVNHLVSQIAGALPDAFYTGYTSCPLITGLGRAMLVEFDYRNNLTPSFPGVIAPLEELWISWVMETVALKPTYLSMLRGRA
ncbi:MAG: NAD(P)/FAD-dependent oxidoreductase [Achromobacter pulmonis]|uniref:FAD/NAD(P)-binding domain-containing protein n=1 Tax=Achromobacter pulmonis TaxID=1389932 RepID=A0A6S7CM29_9BURK|nr:FAD/NAD(P)-binding oxidoreductase [Achromobacter pulmonis]MPT27450.1 NAD(P)/FAD-dependent oxidoreductase [Achromobacter sp.]CAB3816424.1 hypothetical protein LMG26788_00037 [Achromobacter pulmonis]